MAAHSWVWVAGPGWALGSCGVDTGLLPGLPGLLHPAAAAAKCTPVLGWACLPAQFPCLRNPPAVFHCTAAVLDDNWLQGHRLQLCPPARVRHPGRGKSTCTRKHAMAGKGLGRSGASQLCHRAPTTPWWPAVLHACCTAVLPYHCTAGQPRRLPQPPRRAARPRQPPAQPPAAHHQSPYRGAAAPPHRHPAHLPQQARAEGRRILCRRIFLHQYLRCCARSVCGGRGRRRREGRGACLMYGACRCCPGRVAVTRVELQL